jgi:hypothetical protein
MEQTLACIRCDRLVSALVDQVLDLPAVTVCQCRGGEVAVVVKPPAARRLLRRDLPPHRPRGSRGT